MTIDDVDTGEDTPVDHFAAVLAALKAAFPMLHVSVSRGEAPDGGLSATMLAIKALMTVCERCIQADHEAFLSAVAALHDDDGEF
jgi:hypothetical protein